MHSFTHQLVPGDMVFLFRDSDTVQAEKNSLKTDASGHYSFNVRGYEDNRVVASRNIFNYKSLLQVTEAVNRVGLLLWMRISKRK